MHCQMVITHFNWIRSHKTIFICHFQYGNSETVESLFYEQKASENEEWFDVIECVHDMNLIDCRTLYLSIIIIPTFFSAFWKVARQ